MCALRWGFWVLVLSFPLASLSQISSQSGPPRPPQPSPLILNAGENWGVGIRQIPPLVFPDGRILLTTGNMIYMISSAGKIDWSYSASGPLTVQPVFRPDRNEIAIVGLDLTFERLNAATGKVVWRSKKVGRSSFDDVKIYRKGYLILVGAAGYRDAALPGERLPEDSLEYYGETENDYWRVSFPIGAKLAVA